MAHHRVALRQGALHVLVLVALTACGTTDPPGDAAVHSGADAGLRIRPGLSVDIFPSGPHYLLPTEGFGRNVAISGARVAVADYLDWWFQGLMLPHVDTFEIVDGAAVKTGQLPAVGYGDLCFGGAMALLGDLLAIGEPCANGGAGAVHVFAWSGGAWVEEPPLLPGPTAAPSRFGSALAMAANRLLVGAPYEPAPGGDAPLPMAGAAYVFARKGGGWVPAARLVPGEPGQADAFGWTLSMTASTVVVSSPWRQGWDSLGNPTGIGRLTVFQLQRDGTWAETATLAANGVGSYEAWATKVALCTDTVFVAGDAWTWPAVRAFQATDVGWEEWHLADATVPPNGFVDGLACDADALAVGMPFTNPPEGTWLGSARLYKKVAGGWGLVGEVTGDSPGDRAGHAVAVDRDVLVVGAPAAVVEGRALGMVKVRRF